MLVILVGNFLLCIFRPFWMLVQHLRVSSLWVWCQFLLILYIFWSRLEQLDLLGLLSYLIFIFNLLCRRTIRQYVEQVLRLCTVLVFPPPFEFSFVHIYTVKSYPHTLSIKILLYTVKILQLVRLLLKVNYMNRIV
jgi:hypothetical protein